MAFKENAANLSYAMATDSANPSIGAMNEA